MSGETPWWDAPGATACQFRVLAGARPSLLLFEIWHHHPPFRHLRTVSASEMHATEIAPRPGAILPLASASSHRPALMVISFPNGARASIHHVHTLFPAACINHLTKRPNIP